MADTGIYTVRLFPIALIFGVMLQNELFLVFRELAPLAA